MAIEEAVRQIVADALDDLLPERQSVQQEYLTPKQAAEYLGIAQQTVYNWRSRRDGPPALRLGPRYLRYKRSDLDAWMQGGGS